MTTFFRLLVIVAVFSVAACVPDLELRDDAYLQDDSLLTDEPCAVPCWQGITPGITTWNEAFIIIRDNPDFTQVDTQTNRQTRQRVATFSYQEGLQCCRVYSADGDLVSSILLLTTPDKSLQEVVEKYGEPQYISAVELADTQASVSLIYPDVPMIVYAFASGFQTGELTAASEITGFVTMIPAEMDATLQSAESQLFDWEGYEPLTTILGREPIVIEPPINEE